MSTRNESPERLSTSWASPLLNWVEGLSDTQFAYVLLIPPFIMFALIAFWPLVRTFEMSLHADALASADPVGEFIGFEHYVKLFTGQLDPVLPQPFFSLQNPFQSMLIVTLGFTVVSVFFETLIGFGQALVLDQDFHGRRWVRVAIIIPWAVPIVVQGMIFYLMFQPGIGFAVEPLKEIGLLVSNTPLVNSRDSFVLIVIADVWKTSAFMALLILAGLQSIDRSLYSVAKVAGASKWQQFKMITLPLVLPTVLVAMLFRTIAAMRFFGIVETMSSCSVVPSLSCMVVTTFSNRRIGTASALAFVTAGIVGLTALIYIVRFHDAEGGAA